ncbi:MAG: phosphatase PAP2 family protein [Clostridium sp.]|nr:phosphatase PAP2 family protein [Clostridium sp.]MCM1398278.1 phosphatase PAP2 family protein [Clostridium sp.]MCM1459058.1 phosphatase PAP2 family protein [Bacteroides sp.]
MIQQLVELDGNILLWIQEHLRTDIMTVIMKAITKLGDKGIFFIAVAVLLMVYKPTRKAGLAALLGLLINLLIVNVWLKNVVDRTRPYYVVQGLQSLLPPQTDSSFPSGHTSHAFVMVAVMWSTMKRKYGVIALVLAILIAFSRLYLGVHYPSDVLAGAVIGLIAGLVSVAIVKRWKQSDSIEEN